MKKDPNSVFNRCLMKNGWIVFESGIDNNLIQNNLIIKNYISRTFRMVHVIFFLGYEIFILFSFDCDLHIETLDRHTTERVIQIS